MKYLNLTMIAFALMIGLMACQQKSSEAEASPEDSTAVEKSFLVRVSAIEPSKVDKTIEYTANLLPYKEVYYAPAAPGRIDHIFVELGSRVQQGQVLLEMDQTQLHLAVTQLNSAMDAYERVAKLNETGSISEQHFEQAKTQVELARTNVDYLKKNASFTAPISGIVTGKYFENGEMYSGAPNTQAGKAAVVTIQQINPLKAIVNISQTFYPQVKKGMGAMFTSDIYPGMTFPGKVNKIYPYIDPATRTFKTEFIINNPSELLKPGMSANMELILEKTEGILLPAIAVLRQSGTNNRYIFVNDQGTARRVEVEVVKRHNGQIEVTSGEPLAGQELVVEGQAKLLNGSRIEIAAN